MKKLIIIIVFALLSLTSCDFTPTSSSTIESSSLSSESTTTSEISSSTSTPSSSDIEFEDFGMPVIEVFLSDTNITYDGLYSSKEEVGAYIFTYHKLPTNFVKKVNLVIPTIQQPTN